MGVKIKGEFLGGGRMKLAHESGHEIVTVPPKDNRGDGSKFSPTDLAVASMGSCITTIMSFVALDNGISFKGVTFEAQKIMQKSPRMIKEITLNIKMPKGLDEIQKKKLERAAFTCPVKRSLHPDIKVTIAFSY